MSEEAQYAPSRFERFAKRVRWNTLVFLAGTIVGAYGLYNKVLLPFETAVIDQGYCGDRDLVFGFPHMYGCRDSLAAMELQQRSIQYDHDLAAKPIEISDEDDTKKILVDMKKKKVHR